MSTTTTSQVPLTPAERIHGDWYVESTQIGEAPVDGSAVELSGTFATSIDDQSDCGPAHAAYLMDMGRTTSG
jgi:hypothetical protein